MGALGCAAEGGCNLLLAGDQKRTENGAMTPARRNVSRVSTCDAKSYLACPARPTFPLHSDPHAPNSIKVGLRASHFRIQNTKVFNPCCFDGNCTVKYKAAFAFADGPNQYGWAVENAKPTTSKREPSKHACIIDGEKDRLENGNIR